MEALWEAYAPFVGLCERFAYPVQKKHGNPSKGALWKLFEISVAILWVWYCIGLIGIRWELDGGRPARLGKVC